MIINEYGPSEMILQKYKFFSEEDGMHPLPTIWVSSNTPYISLNNSKSSKFVIQYFNKIFEYLIQSRYLFRNCRKHNYLNKMCQCSGQLSQYPCTEIVDGESNMDINANAQVYCKTFVLSYSWMGRGMRKEIFYVCVNRKTIISMPMGSTLVSGVECWLPLLWVLASLRIH